jgi:catechol 2,3-dioxygenase-like lactoylglutathione lyase family enzyme
MKAHVSAITLGVKDMDRAKSFYAEGLGWPIAQDHGQFVSFSVGEGSSTLGLYTWEGLAADAGVPAEGSGFRGVTFSYIVRSDATVDAVMAEAERAGGTIVKPAEKAQWGGYGGHFADPDGYLWKITSGEGEQPYADD